MPRTAPGKRPLKSPDETALVRRIAGAVPLSSALGRARLAEWLASNARKTAGRALKSLIAEHPPLASLLGGIAEAAPYLWDLIGADPARLVRLLSRDPDDELAALLAATRSAAAAAQRVR